MKAKTDSMRFIENLRVGYRFKPTDQELIEYYLYRKVHGLDIGNDVIGEADVFDLHPNELRTLANYDPGDGNLYFFAPRSQRYSTGSRPRRQSESGTHTWKQGQQAVEVKDKYGRIIGSNTYLKYEIGKEKKDWMMHEYKLPENTPMPRSLNSGKGKEKFMDLVLCRVYPKKKSPPKNAEKKTKSKDVGVRFRNDGASSSGTQQQLQPQPQPQPLNCYNPCSNTSNFVSDQSVRLQGSYPKANFYNPSSITSSIASDRSVRLQGTYTRENCYNPSSSTSNIASDQSVCLQGTYPRASFLTYDYFPNASSGTESDEEIYGKLEDII